MIIKIRKIFWNNVELIITGLLLFLAAMSFYLSLKVNEPTKSLLVNLVAGFIGSIVIIWGVEFLRRKQIELRWEAAKNVAKDDITTLSNMLVSHISGSFGITIYQYKDEGESVEEWGLKAIKRIADDMRNKNLTKLLNKMSVEQWREFKINLQIIKLTLGEKLQLYNDVLPPEILGQLLKIKNDFDNFYRLFNIFPDLFTKSENNWPPNKRGIKNNRAIRIVLIENMSNDFKKYFGGIYILIGLLENTRF